MPPVTFDVEHMREHLNDLEVALLRLALERQDPAEPGAHPAAAELLRRITDAEAQPLQVVSVDRDVAAALVGAINLIDHEGDATATLIGLRGRARDLTDTVTVLYRRGDVELRKSSRDLLLAEVRQLDSAAGVRLAFAGDADPVRFATADDKRLIVEAIELMSRNAGGVQNLRADLWDLRNALVDDLNDTVGRP